MSANSSVEEMQAAVEYLVDCEVRMTSRSYNARGE